jgi:3-ketosteroid 9alpha-monooxygenase subunit B
MTGRQPYHRVRVADVIKETSDAHSLVLQVPDDLAADFAYRPGQFLTVRVPHEANGSIARCYSLSSSPHTDRELKVTVKRVPGGHASNWICDHVTPGTVVELMPPAGSFTPGSLDDDLLLLAAGSGITPVISILKSALSQGSGHIALVYANRDEQSIIFGAELSRIEVRHRERLHVVHWLDATQGPPTVAALDPLIRSYAGRDAFVCGPEPYLAVACEALGERGVPQSRIHIERFQSLVDNPFTTPEAGAADERIATAVVTMDGQTHRLPWPAHTRLLDLLITAGLNPPYSCRQGICGACACQVVAGEVELLHNEVLEDEDFADGYTLACQALPRSDTVSVTYS